MNLLAYQKLILRIAAGFALLFLVGCDSAGVLAMDLKELPLPVLLGTIALATLLSEDLTCIGAGILVSRGDISFLSATLACFVGIYAGDLLLYAIGRFAGKTALHRVPLKWFIDEPRVSAAREFFRRHGGKIVFTTRVLPGSRTAVYFAAGLAKAPFLRLAGLFFVAVALWTPLLVGLSVLLGRPMLAFFEQFQLWALPSLIAVVLLIWLVIKILLPLFTWKGRRLFLCRWRRLTQYEFWPSWAFYLPLLPTAVGLMIKHRRFLSFLTATNPGIPHSGVVLESKSQILKNLAASPEFVARWKLLSRDLPATDREQQLSEFMRKEELTFPIVLKPDIGERGNGVGIIRNSASALDYLERCSDDVIAQEFVDGPEFGIFYLRHPEEPSGRIFSITRKELLHIEGDGEHSLEELILGDDRAVSMSPFFLRKHAAHLSEVIARGERFTLAEIGTHARGSVFLEGADLITDELSHCIDRISLGFEGFHFGRYDIRGVSEDALRKGQGFKILELNGLTSESTNIFDPKHSLRFAQRTTRELWKTAGRFASVNIKRGAPVTPVRELLSILRAFKARQTFEA